MAPFWVFRENTGDFGLVVIAIVVEGLEFDKEVLEREDLAAVGLNWEIV